MPIKENFLEQTAETQISRQKLPINQYAVPQDLDKSGKCYTGF